MGNEMENASPLPLLAKWQYSITYSSGYLKKFKTVQKLFKGENFNGNLNKDHRMSESEMQDELDSDNG